jgi:UDP-glucose 4-epimerase
LKTVIIGGNGFIGSHIVDHLVVDKWRVTVYDRFLERYRPPLRKVEYVIGELGNIGLLNSVLPGSDVVFHLASTTIPQTSNESPTFDIQSNLVDTLGLLDACIKNKVKKIVFISSGGTVYGIPRYLPVDENHPTNPICSYGIIKLVIEKYIQLYHHLYGLSYAILRPSNPYGERQNPIGVQGVIAVFLGRIVRDQPIILWGDGEIVRDFIHVIDLARAATLSASSMVTNGIMNIGSGKSTSLNLLLELIQTIVKKPVEIHKMPPRSFDVQRIILDINQVKTTLNWEPSILLDNGIASTWQWITSLKLSDTK